MDTVEVLTRIQSSGLTLRASGDRLVVDSTQPLTAQQRQFIRRHKGAILKALTADSTVPTAPARPAAVAGSTAVTEPLPNRIAPAADICPLVPRVDADRQEAFEERAAIMEFDGGLPRRDAERKAAAANRLAMPHVAEFVDQARAVFGADQVRVVYAEENGRTLGTPPATEPAPHHQQESPRLIAECRTCLRFDPRAHYCGHRLRVIRQGDGVICAGRGYSPKGELWKEVQP